MPDMNTVSSYTSRAAEYLMYPFQSDEPTWKRVMSVVVPLFIIGTGIAIAVRRYYSYPSDVRPTKDSSTELSELQQALKRTIEPIEPIPFEKVKARHEEAKKSFSHALAVFGILVKESKVRYVKADMIANPNPRFQILLNPALFCWSKTQGVKEDILAASHRADEIHLFSVASQYNVTEATHPFTPLPGEAMLRSTGDNTQGPISQRTNPRLFELVNGYLANGGFNMLAYVLSQKSSKALEHGYLSPRDPNIEKEVAEDFEKSWTQVEQPCVSSHPEGGGPHLVYLMMGAAPAYGRYCQPSVLTMAKKIQYYAALANFTAQLNQVLHLAKTHPDKKIVYHAAGIGLGVFGNDAVEVGEAFKTAASHFQEELGKVSINTTKVQIQFDVLERNGSLEENTLACVKAAGLQEKPSTLA